MSLKLPCIKLKTLYNISYFCEKYMLSNHIHLKRNMHNYITKSLNNYLIEQKETLEEIKISSRNKEKEYELFMETDKGDLTLKYYIELTESNINDIKKLENNIIEIDKYIRILDRSKFDTPETFLENIYGHECIMEMLEDIFHSYS